MQERKPTGTRVGAVEAGFAKIEEPGAANPHARFYGVRWHKKATPVHQGHNLERDRKPRLVLWHKLSRPLPSHQSATGHLLAMTADN